MKIFIYLYMIGSISIGCHSIWIFGMSKINKEIQQVARSHKNTGQDLIFYNSELRSFLFHHTFYSVEEYMS